MMETLLNFIPAVMGLGVIDENLNGLLEAMKNPPVDLSMPSLMGYAKMIGLCIALGVGANECYQMMLGRRGMDVMKLLHIVIISFCISLSGSIASMASAPGAILEGIAKSSMEKMHSTVLEKEKEVAHYQEQYIEKIRESMQQMEEAQKAAHAKEEAGDIKEQFLNFIEEQFDHLTNIIKEYALMAETKISEWITLVLSLIGEVLLQAIIYGLLVCQRIGMHLLEMVAPLMFAISLSPHFKSAWSQWLSKYISVSLWGFVTYVGMYYAFFIMYYNLKQDIASYMRLLGPSAVGDAQIAAIGMQALGSTCMYLIGLIVGVKVLSMVPEMASWLIPGGVSSSAGSAAAGTATAGASMIGGAAGAAVGMAAPLAAAEVGTVMRDAGSAAGAVGNAAKWNHDNNWGTAINQSSRSFQKNEY